MKILFVTGGEDCQCKGTGIIKRVIEYFPPITIKVMCDCVEAREAVTEDNTVYDDDPQPVRVIPV